MHSENDDDGLCVRTVDDDGAEDDDYDDDDDDDGVVVVVMVMMMTVTPQLGIKTRATKWAACCSEPL